MSDERCWSSSACLTFDQAFAAHSAWRRSAKATGSRKFGMTGDSAKIQRDPLVWRDHGGAIVVYVAVLHQLIKLFWAIYQEKQNEFVLCVAVP